MSQPIPPHHEARLKQLAAACKALNREVVKLQGEMFKDKILWPEPLIVVLSDFDRELDRMTYMLIPSYISNYGQDATNQARRDDSLSPVPTQPEVTAQDGREAAPQ